jgi:MoaA/NifB/PqqE/SkfB family radical SAM enzyme
MSQFIVRKENFGGLLIDLCNPDDATPLSPPQFSILESISERGFESTWELVEQGYDGEELMVIRNYIDEIRSLGVLDQNSVCYRLVVNPANEKWLSAPLKAYIEVTRMCGLKCLHCYNSSGKPMEGEMTTKELIGVIDEFYVMGIPEVSLSGGDLLLRKDIFEVMDQLEKYSMKVSMSLNAITLDEEIAKRLASYKNLNNVSVSLEGTEEVQSGIRGKRAYAAATAGLARLQEAGLDVKLHLTLNALTIKHVEAIKSLILRLGVGRFSVAELKPLGRALLHHKEMYDFTPREAAAAVASFLKLKEHNLEVYGTGEVSQEKAENAPSKRHPAGLDLYCYAGISAINVRADGTVIPCIFLEEYFKVSGLELPSIRDHSLKEIWANDPVFGFVRDEVAVGEGKTVACPAISLFFDQKFLAPPRLLSTPDVKYAKAIEEEQLLKKWRNRSKQGVELSEDLIAEYGPAGVPQYPC